MEATGVLYLRAGHGHDRRSFRFVRDRMGNQEQESRHRKNGNRRSKGVSELASVIFFNLTPRLGT